MCKFLFLCVLIKSYKINYVFIKLYELFLKISSHLLISPNCFYLGTHVFAFNIIKY